MQRQDLLKQTGKMALIAIGSLFFLEIFCRCIFVYANFPESYALKAFQRKYDLAAAKDNADIILLGDSQMDFAVFPELMTHELYQAGAALDVLNLASPSVTPTLSLKLLEKKIQSGHRPQWVVINVNTRHFDGLTLADPSQTIEANLNKTYLGQCQLPKEKIFSRQIYCALAKQSYLLRYRSKIKALLQKTETLLLKPDRLRQASVQYDIYPAKEVSPKGWAPGYAISFDEQQFLAFSQSRSPKAKQSPDHKAVQPTRRYLWSETPMQALVDYCRHRHIRLILLALPLRPEMQNQSIISPIMFSEKLQAFSKKNEIVFLDWRHHLPDYVNYVDGDHLNVVGALTLTRELSRYLASQEKLQSSFISAEDKSNLKKTGMVLDAEGLKIP